MPQSCLIKKIEQGVTTKFPVEAKKTAMEAVG
jgi:hypothetical protein